MRQMAHGGELAALTAERVWKETEKALQSQSPQVYFQVLRDCDALAVLFPEIDALFGVPAPAKWHPEIDTGVHTLMALAIAARLTPEVDVRFATLCHDLGKGLTPKEFWPHHHGHGPAGVRLVEALCQRLRVPNPVRDLSKLVAEYHDLIHTVDKLRPETLLKLFDAIDVWRKPQRLEQMILTSEADARGRTGFEENPYPQGDYLRPGVSGGERGIYQRSGGQRAAGHRDPRRAQTPPPAGAGRLETQPNDYQRSGIKTPQSGVFLASGLQEYHVNHGCHDKAVDGERHERDAFDQRQEGLDRNQRHHEGRNETDGKHRQIAPGQEVQALVQIQPLAPIIIGTAR